jgi:hypothetical protein
MSDPADQPLAGRIQSVLGTDAAASGATETVLTDGYAHALQLDGERMKLERRITVLAARAEQPDAAHELRDAWLRHRTVTAELRELRAMLRQLRDDASA